MRRASIKNMKMIINSIFRKKEASEIKSRVIDNKIAVLSFSGEMKNKIISEFNNNYQIEGDHIKTGGKASKSPLLSLIGAGGAFSASSLSSGSLFMATANPATLMAINNGVGSAVMGASGIVAQAPFIPVQGAMMPVIAPLIVMQTISSIQTINQFKLVSEKLNNIERKIDGLIKRDIAADVGVIISSTNRINELESQFEICNSMSQNMIIRLALIEDKINPIFEKYSFLHNCRKNDREISKNEILTQHRDAQIAILGSILDLRVDILKIKLFVQENPAYLEGAINKLKEKVNNYKVLWCSIGNMESELSDIQTDLNDAINKMNKWQKLAPSWALGKKENKLEMQEKSNSIENVKNNLTANLQKDATQASKLGENIIRELLPETEAISLIYWEDEKGKHSYYTSDLIIQT